MGTTIGDKIVAASEQIYNATAESVSDITGSETTASAAGNAIYALIAFGVIYVWKL